MSDTAHALALRPRPRLSVLAAGIREAHGRAVEYARVAILTAVEAGRLLKEAKQLVGHSHWYEWLERECGLHERTASRYMKAVDRVEQMRAAGQIGHMSDLAGWSLNRLLAPAEAAATERREQLAASRLAKLARIGEAARLEDLGRFAVIVADPPYPYDFSSDPADDIENHYPTMTIEEICALRVPDISFETSVLYLWSPAPKLKEAMVVLEAWGFEYKTGAVWDKGRAGRGYHFRQRHEHLLVGTRGEMPVPEPEVLEESIICAPYRGHSVKPVEVLEIAERYYPGLPKAELFRRGPAREGWSPWGNECEGGAA